MFRGRTKRERAACATFVGRTAAKVFRAAGHPDAQQPVPNQGQSAQSQPAIPLRNQSRIEWFVVSGRVRAVCFGADCGDVSLGEARRAARDCARHPTRTQSQHPTHDSTKRAPDQ